MPIRPATPADAPAIAAIYDAHARTGTGTFDVEGPPAADMAARIAAVQARGWPWLVAEEAGAVTGYAYAAQFRDRPAYAHCCEDSIYVAEPGRGTGRALLDALMAAAAAAGFREMVAVIGDADNRGSVVLHERAGFRHVGRLEGVGLKFGRLLDVVFMQRALP
ncbi:MAG: GNAT family N-acetyltransferase [Sphingomonas fennica]